MTKPPLPHAHELYAVIDALETELETLDRLGAGIAAVHVNAAIEQLRGNLAIVNDNSGSAFDPALLCLLPHNDDPPIHYRKIPRD